MTEGAAAIVKVFEERFVAFIDILGFARHAERAADDSALAGQLKDILQGNQILGPVLKAIYQRNAREADIADHAHAAFSDSIVFSARKAETVVLPALGLQRTLVNQGLLCRGAVTCGPLFHEGSVVFGPAMVRAYRIETSAAIFPRIVVDHRALDRVRADVPWMPLEQDSDGQSFLPVFSGWPTKRDDVVTLRERLMSGLRDAEASDDAGILSKWKWIIRRFDAAHSGTR